MCILRVFSIGSLIVLATFAVPMFLAGMFDSSRTADETASKPHPLMLQELMAEFGIAPDRTLMIGDSSNDAKAARAAGCAVVGSAVPGVREVVEHGVDGLLVPEADAQALAGALERVLRDAVFGARLGAAAQLLLDAPTLSAAVSLLALGAFLKRPPSQER